MWKYIRKHKKVDSKMLCENRVFYIGAYCGDVNELKRQDIRTNPAGTTKMDYIIHALKDSGRKVTLFAIAPSKRSGYCPEEIIIKDSLEERIYLPSLVIRILGKNIVRGDLSCYFIKKYIRKYVKEGDTVVAYHSLLYKDLLAKLRQEIRFKLVLEVEEIYHEVIKCKAIVQKQELEILQDADGYIFSTINLNERINQKKLPMIVVNGNYLGEKHVTTDIFRDGKYHCVYAGILEASKGAALAIRTAEYLSERYVVHILGYGSMQEVEEVQKLIKDIQGKTDCEIRYEGMLSGEAYYSLLQSAHVGLCTQNLDASYNSTSFPSKVLVYLANGLRVVSGNVDTIRNSSVGEQLYYYNQSTPEEVAACITQIDFSKEYDSRKVLKKLDKEIVNDIGKMLYEINNRNKRANIK